MTEPEIKPSHWARMAPEERDALLLGVAGVAGGMAALSAVAVAMGVSGVGATRDMVADGIDLIISVLASGNQEDGEDLALAIAAKVGDLRGDREGAVRAMLRAIQDAGPDHDEAG